MNNLALSLIILAALTASFVTQKAMSHDVPRSPDYTVNYLLVGDSYPAVYRIENDEVVCYYVGDSVQCNFKNKH